MRRHAIKLLLLTLAGALVSSCLTNIDARTYLAKCKYEYAGLSVKCVEFSPGLLIDSVDLAVKVKITNTTDRDVALDHVDLSFFLDENHVLDATHNNFVRIVSETCSTETVIVKLPFRNIITAIGHRPQTLSIKGKLWLTLLVGKDTWETPLAWPLDVEYPIPWDQIGGLFRRFLSSLFLD